jgi:SAM-dependent methyltransferase
MSYARLSSCLACGGDHLEPYLDLGDQPLANSFHRGAEPLAVFPLGVAVCQDCWHTQLTAAVDPDLMFKNYLYVSGTTTTLSDYFEQFVTRVEQGMPSPGPLSVLDIASNDGSLLEKFKARGHSVQGVDPAENLRVLSHAKGIPTLVSYWGAAAAEEIGQKFDVIIAMNVLAHITYPMQFLQVCREALKPGGRIFIQTSQAKMIQNGEFDTIYHEHHSFFSVRSFIALAYRAGLAVRDITHVPVHGTSYLVELEVENSGDREQDFNEFELGRTEALLGNYEMPSYRAFADRALVTRDKVREIVAWARDAGYQIGGYGAAAKGMTFVNFAQLDLDFVVDDNPLKVGLLTPGQNALVVPATHINEVETRILFVILAWNFYDEIMRRIKVQRINPLDSFLTYFPQVHLIG